VLNTAVSASAGQFSISYSISRHHSPCSAEIILMPASPPRSPTSSPSVGNASFTEDATIDDIALQFMAVSLHDDGPDMDSLDGRVWKSRDEAQRDSRLNGLASDTPAEISADDIMSGIEELSSRPPPPPTRSPPPPTRPRRKLNPVNYEELKRDRNIRTKRVLMAFEVIAQRIEVVSKALDEFTQAPSHERFDEIHEMLTSIDEDMQKHTRSTTSIDTKRAELVPRLRALYNRMQELGLLLPETCRPKEYPIGRCHFIAVYDSVS
jgi:hypothetical protein